jgi:hypothetical protein
MSLISSSKKYNRIVAREPRSTSPSDFLEADTEVISSRHLLRMCRQEERAARGNQKSNNNEAVLPTDFKLAEANDGSFLYSPRRRLDAGAAGDSALEARRKRKEIADIPLNQPIADSGESSDNLPSYSEQTSITSTHINNMFRAVANMYYQPKRDEEHAGLKILCSYSLLKCLGTFMKKDSFISSAICFSLLSTRWPRRLLHSRVLINPLGLVSSFAMMITLIVSRQVSRSAFDDWTPREIALFEVAASGYS